MLPVHLTSLKIRLDWDARLDQPVHAQVFVIPGCVEGGHVEADEKHVDGNEHVDALIFHAHGQEHDSKCRFGTSLPKCRSSC